MPLFGIHTYGGLQLTYFVDKRFWDDLCFLIIDCFYGT